ncbi:MAG: hypothetical protein JW996_06725 [Candidatus Cloacimonetes bacterium]|nr:hypothetical protein [Candidatus Cloacimonadota bacterium]
MRSLITFLILSTFFLSSCVTGTSSKIEPVQVTEDRTLDTQLRYLTSQIVLSLSQQKTSKIAVVEFADLKGNITEFGRFLAEELITRLYLTGEFEVIERQMLNKVLQEHQLSLSGIVDESSAKELGRILGVDAIASGSIADMISNVKVNARLISAETGKVFSVASVEIPKDGIIKKMMGESISPVPAEFSSESHEEVKPLSSSEIDKFKPISHTINSGGYSFEIIGCRLVNRKVICNFIVTNTEEFDKDLTIWFLHTKFFDQLGSEYVMTYLKLANSESNPAHSNWGGSSRLGKKLISGVPTPLEIQFDSVSSQVASISLLEINCGSMVVEFRTLNFQ